MNAKESIEVIKYASAFNADNSKLTKALNIAINALEKQISKKPKISASTQDFEYMQCPSCKLTTVLYYGMRPSYCANCGQKLKWW